MVSACPGRSLSAKPGQGMPEGCIFPGVGVMVLPSTRTFPPVCAGNQNVPDNGASPREWVTVVMIVPPVLRCSSVKRCRPIRQSSSLNRSSVLGLVRGKVEEQVAIPAERTVPGVDAGPVLAPFPEGPGVHFGELLPAWGQVRRKGGRSHVAVHRPQRVALRRQGAGVPREDVDAGKVDGCSEVQEPREFAFVSNQVLLAGSSDVRADLPSFRRGRSRPTAPASAWGLP
jgi:hypothetical protein